MLAERSRIIQDKFSWKSVGISAISAGLAQGLGDVLPIDIAGSKLLGDVARGAIVNAGTQGIAVATGLQDKFSWTGVAAAGVVSGTIGAAGRA
ncbi:MAG: hypothetical protein H7X93_01005, partial [Sphingomonadaceae bacterium]|nr:hypothetical protein [Sphingomonadaceae bacterium]